MHEQPRCRIAGGHSAGDGARNDQDRIGLALGNNAIDLGVGLAEQAHRVARRPQRAFGGLLVRGRLLHVFLRYRACLVELAQPGKIPGRELQHPRGGDQGRLCLQEIGAVDREQRLPLLHVIADLAKETDDPALIGGKHLDRHFLIEIDAADRLLLDRKLPLAGRLDLDRSELRIREIDGGRTACVAASGT